MFSPLARAARPPLVAIFFLVSLFALPARAELVWSPGAGWSVEGGALSGLIGEEANNALELMNRAREAEERGNTRSAMRACYTDHWKRMPLRVLVHMRRAIQFAHDEAQKIRHAAAMN